MLITIQGDFCAPMILDSSQYVYKADRHYLIKVKVTLAQATKAQRGSRGTTVLFLQPRR